MMDRNNSAERRAEVLAAINHIVDPCSAAVGTPVGLVDLGLVEHVELDAGHVDLILTTTSPYCMFVGHFEEEIERRVGALPWVDAVHVTMSYATIWDDTRMSEAARARLIERHRRPRGHVLDVLQTQQRSVSA